MTVDDGAGISALRVDDEGLLVHGRGDFPVDVLFGEQRILSFWLERDTVARDGARLFAWPDQLRRYLDGAVSVVLRSPVDATVWASATAVLGSGEGEVAVVDATGQPLGMDKSMRLSRLFGDRDAAAMTPLLDALEEVLDALERAGVRPFVAYGTLLGAVRDGDVIGHDSDADIGYVSDHDHPVDVVRESFQLQRRLRAMGYRVQRYSGLGLKVLVREPDGAWRGLDVFGGFQREGMLYLMGEVGHPFRTEWLHPRGTATLAGRTVPVPAAPEHLLEAMYGPGWKVPDPAFKFTTPVTTTRRLDGWFRGTRVGIEARWRRFRGRTEPYPDAPSGFVRWVRERTPGVGHYVDLGCGRGLDVVWLAEQGALATGLDYFHPDLRHGRRLAAERGLPEGAATFAWLNLRELRSVLSTAARLARTPGPRVVLARHVLDATDRGGVAEVLRLGRTLTRGGGACYLQFQVAPTAYGRAAGLRVVVEDDVRELAERSGGRVLETVRLAESQADSQGESQAGTTGGDDAAGAAIVRMVVSWE